MHLIDGRPARVAGGETPDDWVSFGRKPAIIQYSMRKKPVETTMIRDECASNFETFLRAARNGDVSLVACKDAKGRDLQVMCVLAHSGNGYAYLPFGLLATPALYPLMNKIQPPTTLKGEWVWDDED